ncbi:dihydroorotase [Terriglobus sp. 2YAB30_2]|uniref:dihydroorotase n=1 Tax=Terriglobus sp. 2YAB30_2 TaxID=3233023 RepID=UPI003F94460A
MKSILIKGGHLIDPPSRTDRPRDLLIHDNKIVELGDPGKLNATAKKEGAEVIDASGLIVAPGLVDIHVHLREPGQSHKETIESGTKAGAMGGFTALCCMPNTSPVNDSPEITRWMLSPERNAVIRVFPVAAATRGSMGEAITEYGSLKAAGAVGVSDDGKPVLQDAVMHQALIAAARAGVPMIQHAENTKITVGASMNAGARAFRLGLRGMSVEAESGIVERDIRLVRELTTSGKGPRPHLHVQHVSTAKAMEAIRHAKRAGLHVTCEVAPHHFMLTDEAVEGYNTHAKMNPPLRSEADRAAMVTALLDGTADCIATDHAPHAVHEKEQEFEKAPNGITGLETSLSLSIKMLHHQHRMPLLRLIHLLSTAPAHIMGLRGRGTLAPEAFADVVLFDPKSTWTFNARNSPSKSRNTPFDGHTLPGVVKMTISEGRIVYKA